MGSYKANAFIYATIVALGGFIFGLDAAIMSGTVNYITQQFSLNEWQLGLVMSSPGWGVIPALPLAGYLSNKFGRKKTIQLVALLYLISALGSTFATNYWTLVTARFLGGMAFCSLSLAAMYIGEIAPSKWRGKLVSVNQINIVVGLSAAYFINYLIVQSVGNGASWSTSLGINDQNIWRWMVGSEIFPALLWLILLFFIPESPSWLVLRNKIEDAKNTLRKIQPAEAIDIQISEMQESASKTEKDQSLSKQLKEILNKPMRLTLIIGVTIAIAQQVTGINAILFYAPTVFEQIGMGTDAAFAQAIWVGLVGVAFTILALLLIDKIGRRPMTIWGLLWLVLSLGICAYGFNSATYKLTDDSITQLDIKNKNVLKELSGKEFNSDATFKKEIIKLFGEQEGKANASAIIQKAANLNATLILFGILSFIAAFHFSIGPVLWVLFSEIFPIALRGVAIPLFALLTSITSVIIQFIFPWQLANMGVAAVFLFYAVFGVIGLVILYKTLPETKNLSIEEIQKKLIRK